MQPEVDRAHAARNQRVLLGLDHADGDIRLALQQVVHAVAEHQLHRQFRVLGLQLRQDGRQHLDADHFAGADAHRAAHAVAMAMGCAHQGGGGVAPCLCPIEGL